MRKTPIAVGIIAAALLAGCKKDIRSENATEEFAGVTRSENPVAQVASDPFVSDEVLVKFKQGSSEYGRANALARISGKVKEKVLTKAMQNVGDDEGFFVVQTPLAVLEAIGRIKDLQDIEYAEPNYRYQHTATSNDPYYTSGYMWGVYGDASSPANQYGSQAGEAWGYANHTGSSSIVVGIIDEGVMYTHDDLKSNIWRNPKEAVGASGVDDDKNGYVDDIYGWDFSENNKTVYDGPQDDHGTHVAGTIGAKGGNGVGVAGVVWNVKMITAKFLGANGGTTTGAIKAIDYLTDLKTRHSLDLVATNNSWGGGGYSQALKDAIDRSSAKNILFIAAAGNGGSDGVGDNNDNTPHYPSSYTSSNIIAVASITSSGAKSSFSNYGSTSVDIGAPGSGIYSTLPSSSNTSTYGSYSGTSMATPHVTGGAALRAAHTSDRGATLKNKIMSTAVPTSSLSGKCVTGGRLNVSSF